MEGHAGWRMASLRFERGYWLWRGMMVEKWLALDSRGYWLWRGMLVGKWLALDSRGYWLWRGMLVRKMACLRFVG